MPDRKLRRSTLAITSGHAPAEPGGPFNQPPVMSSVFREGGDYLYARNGNPTWAALEDAIGALEGGRALVFSSGMAAISVIVEATCSVGDKIVVQRDIYYGSLNLFQKLESKGKLTVETAGLEADELAAAAAGARLVWLESPTNPMLSIVDLAAVAASAHEAGALVVVDNTFATPLLQQPLDLGADIVMHSVTKFISGHSDLLMGAVATRSDDLFDAFLDQRASGGAIPGPLETFMALRGLRTLPVRIEKGQANALELARRMEDHPRIRNVLYPGLETHPGHELARKQMSGFGAMLSFEVDGDADDADNVCARVEIIRRSTSLGGVETSMERRARWRGEERTPPSLIRMSIGCEDVEDLWDDLTAALDSI